MSNFLETQPHQFSRFIETTPVQAMIDVGTQRQQKYDQGVQAIQGQIDQIASLPISRPVDKEYMQTSLSGLQENLKKFATADFSQMSVQSTVSGLTNKIAKDPNIQAAVYSSMNRQQQLAQRDVFQKDGKTSAANDDDFEYNWNQYLNSKELGRTFSDKYTPYLDVNKRIGELGKEVGIDSNIIQNIFETYTDKDGKTQYKIGRDGKPIVNMVMAEQHLKGKDPQKVLAYIQNGLGPEYYNQLAIDGRYHYKNSTPDQIAYDGTKTYLEDLDRTKSLQLEDQIKLFRLNKQNKLTEDDQKLRDQLNDNVSNYDLRIQDLSKKISSIKEAVYANPRAAAGAIYTDGHLLQMAKGIGQIERESLIKNNPMWDAMMKQKEFVELQKYRNAELAQKEKFHKDEMMIKGYKLLANGNYVKNELPKPISPDENKTQGLDFLETQQTSLNDQNSALNRDLAIEFLKRFNLNKPWTQGKSDAQIEEYIARESEKTAKLNGETLDQYYARFSSKMIEDYSLATDKSAYNQISTKIEAVRNNLSKLGVINKTLENEFKNAQSQLGLSGYDYNSIKGKIQPAKIPLIDGFGNNLGTVNMSSEDMFQLAKYKYHTEEGFLPSFFDSKKVTEEAEKAKQYLINKFGEQGFNKIDKYIKYSAVNSKEYYIPANQQLRSVVNILADDNFSKVRKSVSQSLESKMSAYKPSQMDITRFEGEKENDYRDRIMSVVNNYKSGVNEDPSFDFDKIKNAILSGKDYTSKVGIYPQLDGSVKYKQEFSLPGEKPISMNISSEEASYLTNSELPANTSTREMTNKVKLLGSNSINTSISQDAPTAYKAAGLTKTNREYQSFSKVNIPGYEVVGTYINDKENRGVWMRLWIIDQKTGKPINPLGITKGNNIGSFYEPFKYETIDDPIRNISNSLTNDDILKEAPQLKNIIKN